MNPLLASFISSLIVAVVTALLTVRLSSRRFYSERWWERKADAYTDIIEALHAKLEFLDAFFALRYDDAPLTTEDVDRMRSASKEADKKVDKLVHIGTFVISEEVEAIFERYQLSRARVNRETRHDEEEEQIRREYKVIDRCLAEVREAAMRDLKVERRATAGEVLELLWLTFRQRSDR